ncbi:hypothetical protein HYH02_012923 [Chlamydomonas schloesseri]|uniref:Uncharacterized protein n=1 Tax=Chlamydomonas schloesseri TaxID=2026947 RepID=A0A835T1Z7_9CHLO|nr:hypothetical protein HYH02_012923 [Chlamydomonas schloesseri]|eukprot:KAG2432349.1 hypothetical protein HYH02_012923 [Chlamydomonas schloesseri]
MGGTEPDVENAGDGVAEAQTKRQDSASSGGARAGAKEPNAVAKAPATITEKQRLLGPFKRFISGPYFDVIPSQYEHVVTSRAHKARLQLKAADPAEPAALGDEAEAKAGSQQPGEKAHDAEMDAQLKALENEDYLGRLKRIVTTKVDTDGEYGLTYEELVPLPFDVPKWHAYVLDIALTVYLVAQATVVMFIAVWHRTISRTWAGMGHHNAFHCLQVENQERAWKSGNVYTKSWLPLIKTCIILYPLVTLLVLVGMAVEYSIRKLMYFRLLSMRILVDWANIAFYNTAFFWYFMITWALMNVWAIYGVAAYYNKFGNNGVDPVSFGTFVVVNLQTVQLLVQYIKLMSTESRLVGLNQLFERAPVEAQRLLEFTYVVEEKQLKDECLLFALSCQSALGKRLLNLFTCGMAAKDWHEKSTHIAFNIERLQQQAANWAEVERNIRQLREEAMEEERISAGGPRPSGASAAANSKSQRFSEKHGKGTDPQEIELRVQGGNGEDAGPAALAPDLGPDGRPTPIQLPKPMISFFGWSPVRSGYWHYYGSLHSFFVTILPHFPSWPFRPDAAYFRLLTIIQLCSVFAVGVIVVLGWLLSTRETNCTKSAKSCNTCLAVHERYFASAEPLCTAMETAVAGIVASANGTWVDNGITKERYCNWACYGNFTPSGTCPALGR